MSAIAAFGIGALVTSSPIHWGTAISEFISFDDPVLIVIVGSPELVDSVRKAISPDRIVADTGDAFALRDRRIVAASAEAASGLLNQLGWIGDPLDQVAMSNDRGRQWEQNRNVPGGGQNRRDLSDEEQEQAELIANLLRKPTLNFAEAGVLLRHMDTTGQF